MNWDDSLVEWYEFHREDYREVQKRLSYCRNIMLHGRVDSAVEMLEKASVFAVLSIQTELDRHEDAFVAWDNGLRLDKAASQTVYGGMKADWLSERRSFDYTEAITRLRDGGPRHARDYIADNFTGLSYTKASFALAMCGVWKLLCIDSNTRRIVNEEYDLDIPDKIRTASSYNEYSDAIVDAVPINEPPFIIQWVMYDESRGEHSRHMAFYRSVLYQ